MKISIETSKFKTLINKAIKGAGKNRFIKYTNYVNIRVKNNVLTLITSDGNNFFYVNEDVTAEDFDIIVGIEKLAKLINQITAEIITLETKEVTTQEDDIAEKQYFLQITGNGEYNLELPINEEFDDPMAEFTINKAFGAVSTDIISKILTVNKPSLSQDVNKPELRGYYIHDKVITTDRYRFTVLNEKVFKKPVLITNTMMELLGVIDDEEVEIYVDQKVIVVKSDRYSIYGYALALAEEFPVDKMENLFKTEFNNLCVVDKKSIMDTLSRLSLFVDGINNSVQLDFKADYVKVSVGDNYENVAYAEANEVTDFSCKVKINYLMSQISTLNEDKFTIKFGNERLIQMSTDSITQMLATLL